MDKAFHAGLNLHEGTVIGDEDHFTLNLVTLLEVGIQVIPRMRGKLLVTQGDTLLLGIEFLDDDLDLLVQGNHLFGIVHAAPGQVGNVDETVYTAQVHKYAIVGNILDDAFEDLTFLKLGDEFAAAGFLLGLEQGLVGNDHVAEFRIDLDDLEIHGLVDELIVVADGLDVDLRTRKEGLDAEHVDDHTALRAGLHEALHDFIVVVGLVDAIPGLQGASLLVGKDQLALAVFCGLHVNFYFITHLQFRIVTELRSCDDTLALVTDVYDYFAFVDAGHDTFHDLVLIHLGKSLVISRLDVCAVLLTGSNRVLESIPIELLGSDGSVQRRLFNFFCHNYLKLLN